MILCVTPNPALDRTVFVEELRPGEVHARLEAAVAAGGKGLNVARAAHRLGSDVSVIAPIGGATGEQVGSLLAAEGIDGRWVRIGGETRTCTIVVDGAGSATVLNEAGPTVDAEGWTAFVEAVGAAAPPEGFVGVSGSVPPGVGPGGFRSLLDTATGQGSIVWVDTSGEALAEAAAVGAKIKVNHRELAEHLRVAPWTDDPLGWAFTSLSRLPVPIAAVTLGDAGAVLRAHGQVWHAAVPPVRPLNPVASGDCFLAGLLTALDRGDGYPEALSLAVASGAANAAARLGADLSLEAVRRVEREVVVEQIG